MREVTPPPPTKLDEQDGRENGVDKEGAVKKNQEAKGQGDTPKRQIELPIFIQEDPTDWIF